MIEKLFLLKNFQEKFINKKDKQRVISILKKILIENSHTIKSLGNNYINSYNKKNLLKYKKKFTNFRVIGIGGSILGAKAIYYFLKHKIKKNFIFIDNLQNWKNDRIKSLFLNLIISKSGNTIETIVNSNILIKKKDTNIFITENKSSYLKTLAKKLQSEVINHNDFIGGRYSILSEVGMLPAELMGLKANHFKQLNSLIKNKFFFNSLVDNVASTYFLSKKKKI